MNDPIFLENPFVGVHMGLCFMTTWQNRNKYGYSQLTVKEAGNRCVPSHRLAVKLLLGPLKEGDQVLHRCGNGQCHNPYHMNVGGDPENRRDKVLHQAAGNLFDRFVLPYGTGGNIVHMQRPLVLSEEESRLPVSFSGFIPDSCFFADWLYPTYDGYRQLCESDWSGEVAGAHRKVYQLFIGRLNRLDIVSHTCGNRACLNPYHLYISGQADSAYLAKFDKRCTVTAKGRLLIADLSISAVDVAKSLGIHWQTVGSLRRSMR